MPPGRQSLRRISSFAGGRKPLESDVERDGRNDSRQLGFGLLHSSLQTLSLALQLLKASFLLVELLRVALIFKRKIHSAAPLFGLLFKVADHFLLYHHAT